MPAHIGSPTPGYGYEEGDPYAEFLPPSLETDEDGEHEFMRSVVFITEETSKGAARNPQEYVDPLLVMTGDAYATASFDDLYEEVCEALRGENPRLIAEMFTLDGRVKRIYEDGSSQEGEVE